MTVLVSTDEGKRCPWCGSQPLIGELPDNDAPQVAVYCAELKCAAKPRVSAPSRFLALAGWNDQVPMVDEDLNVKRVEKRLILTAFERFKGSRTEMIKHLGIGYRTLQGKLREYGFGPRAKPDSAAPKPVESSVPQGTS